MSDAGDVGEDLETVEPSRKPGGMPWISREISLGTLLVALTALIGLVTWAVTASNHADQTARDQAAMQSAVTEKITDLRTAVTQGLAEVRAQISSLPDQRAQLEQVQRRLGEIEARLNNGDTRLSGLERSSIETRSDVNQMLRVTNIPLPKGR